MSGTDVVAREQLEAERDFLLRSLDDLEAERESGGIDDESYRALHDDYTARAAAVIRALRDGVDARPTGPSTPVSRRVLMIAALAVFAVGASLALASALGDRRPGETSSGNSQSRDDGPTARSLRGRLEAALEEDPTDVDSRMQLAFVLERDDELAGALEQYDEVLALDPANAPALAQSARILYNVARGSPDQAPDLVEQSRQRLDAAVAADPEYPDSYFFRAIVLANEFGEFAAAQRDLQMYLRLAPDGLFIDQARQLLEDVTEALEPTTTSAP